MLNSKHKVYGGDIEVKRKDMEFVNNVSEGLVLIINT